jgi:hypothetical protein
MLSPSIFSARSRIIGIIHEILTGMANAPGRTDDNTDGLRPEWVAAFLADRGTRKPSAHTLKAYRQDFDAIATLIAGGEDSVRTRPNSGPGRLQRTESDGGQRAERA